MYHRILFIPCLILLIVACVQDEPLKSLNSQDRSNRFNLSYWMEQASRHTHVWQSAKRICQNMDPLSMNCMQVKHAALLMGEHWSSGFGQQEENYGRH